MYQTTLQISELLVIWHQVDRITKAKQYLAILFEESELMDVSLMAWTKARSMMRIKLVCHSHNFAQFHLVFAINRNSIIWSPRDWSFLSGFPANQFIIFVGMFEHGVSCDRHQSNRID
jgi:hypothetical protein